MDCGDEPARRLGLGVPLGEALDTTGPAAWIALAPPAGLVLLPARRDRGGFALTVLDRTRARGLPGL
ncbi:hypothetical protein [Streptomyces sp. NPDC053728]|uniref:hypothetical protein n=1 Tax=Streptomyces sp. NPDC053728 TaxID=3155534 RepID=UPI0034406B22